MPISKYFKGHGSEVMSNMTKEYGPEEGKRVFYATANKTGMKAPLEKAKGILSSRRRPKKAA